MTIKPFEIQGAELVLGGVQLQAGTTGVVIPGVTQATNYRVEEVEDTGDQTQTFSQTIVVIDYVTYQDILNGVDGSGRADYSLELDDENYIDDLEVNGRGSYTSQEATDNASNDMYAYSGSGSASERPINPNDWVQIPFRPKMRAGQVERIGGDGGATSLEDLDDVQLEGPVEGSVLTWDANEEKWVNRTPTGGPGLGSFTIDGNVLEVEPGSDIYIETSEDGGSGESRLVLKPDDDQSGSNPTRLEGSYGVGIWANTTDSGNVKKWLFGSNGDLKLPAGGDIVDSTGASVLGGAGSTASQGISKGTFSTLPSFLDFYSGTEIRAGQNENGVFFSGDADEDTIAYPIRTNFSIAGSTKVVVTLDMVVNAEGSDFGICVFESGVQPQWNWGPNNTRIAVQYNMVNPEISGIEGMVGGEESSWSLPGDGTYKVRFTYDPNNSPNVQLETLDSSNTVINTLTYDEILNTNNSYYIGFGADQDDNDLRTYIKNLTIAVDSGDTYTDSLLIGGSGSSSLDPYVTIVDSKVTVTADLDFPASDVAGAIATVGGNFNFGVYFQETTGDADGNMYAAGKSYEDSSYAIVYAFNPSGSVRWKTNLTISGNTQAPDLHNIKLKGDYVYVGFTYYDNDAGSEYHGVAKLVAETGSLNYDWIIETPQNTYPQIYDIAINANDEPIMVGTYGNGLDTLSNVPTQAGGGINSVIFNTSDLEGYTSQSGWGGQWQVETAPGVFSYPDYINTAYVPVTNVTNPSATGMIAAFRYDQNQNTYWGGVIINDPGTYNVGDQLMVPGSLLFGTDGGTTITAVPSGLYQNGDIVTMYFDKATYPNLYTQLTSCSFGANYNGNGPYNIANTVRDNGANWEVDLSSSDTTITPVEFYTQYGNDATWSFNGGQLNGLSGTPSPELKAKTWFSWNSPGPNGSQTDFTSSTNVNLKAYLGNQAMIWTPSWNYTYGTSDSEYFYGVAYDSANDKIYVAGEFWGQVNGTYHEGTLFKINGSDGTVDWSKYVEDDTGASDNLRSVLVDSDGNVITVGENNNGYTLVTKLNSDGDVVWQARQTNNNNWDNEARGAIDSDGNVYVTGVFSGNNNYVSIMKLNGNDGSLNWARTFNNSEGYNFNEFGDEDSQTTNVAGTNLYYGGRSYDANDDEYIAVALRLPIDGTNTGTYGRWVYAEDTNAQWEDCTDSVNIYTATFPAVTFDGQNLTGERTYSNIDSVGNPTATAITLGGGGSNITNVGGITFADGTTQTTAAVSNPPITWTNGNGNTWRIETYNGGYNGTYNGDDYDAKWFDVNDAPNGDNNFRGAIIEYHAYFNGQGTMVGTIHISRDNDSGDYATHTEHMSGDSNMQKMSVWITNGNDRRLYFKRTDGNTQDIMIQWTAKIFYGSEYYC